jgi:signal transduction histidine kinase
MVRGVVDKVRNLVASLFPVSDDTRLDEIESLYKNAQQQIRLAIKDKTQKRKALELLDLQYLAVLEDKR